MPGTASNTGEDDGGVGVVVKRILVTKSPIGDYQGENLIAIGAVRNGPNKDVRNDA